MWNNLLVMFHRSDLLDNLEIKKAMIHRNMHFFRTLSLNCLMFWSVLNTVKIVVEVLCQRNANLRTADNLNLILFTADLKEFLKAGTYPIEPTISKNIRGELEIIILIETTRTQIY